MTHCYEVTRAVIQEINDERELFTDVDCHYFSQSPASFCSSDSSSDLTSVTSRSLSDNSLCYDRYKDQSRQDTAASKKGKPSNRFCKIFPRLDLERKLRPMSNQSVKRANMSFSSEQTRRIKRENEILLKKIMSQSLALTANPTRANTLQCSAEVNRRRFQEKINQENLFGVHFKKGNVRQDLLKKILLKKIQQAKPTQAIQRKNNAFTKWRMDSQ